MSLAILEQPFLCNSWMLAPFQPGDAPQADFFGLSLKDDMLEMTVKLYVSAIWRASKRSPLANMNFVKLHFKATSIGTKTTPKDGSGTSPR
eukprot:1088720-Amphidinium_carterae.1